MGVHILGANYSVAGYSELSVHASILHWKCECKSKSTEDMIHKHIAIHTSNFTVPVFLLHYSNSIKVK
jgi:hypothetical protein